MNIRKMKKEGVVLNKIYLKKKRPPHYKKGWSSFQEHHIENREGKGGDSKKNKILLSGKIHYCWHQVFGNLNPSEAKLFVILFLHGFRTKWRVKDIRNLLYRIKTKDFFEAKQISLYCGNQDKKMFLVSNSRKKSSKNHKIESKKLSGHFLWCWNELFENLSADDIQLFISMLFGNTQRKWNIKSVRALKKAINENKIQEAASIACLSLNFSYVLYTNTLSDALSANAA